MATTTPNYLWSVPTSSDLVKNGATAIETLGDSVDASLWNSGFGQAGKNKIINGDFTVNQRAFSSTTTDGTYTFDRWQAKTTDGTNTFSSQTFTAGTAPVAGYEGKNYLRIVTSGQTATNARTNIQQPIENVRVFAGQTVTVSFWAKAASGTPSIAPELLQSFGTGGSPSSIVNTIIASPAKQAITTSWARYSFNISVPSISGKTVGTTDNTSALFLLLWVSAGSDFNARTGSLGIQTNTFEFWGVQVEYGSYATPFQTATGTIQGELAACQRYYQRFGAKNGQTVGTNATYGTGFTTSTTGVNITVPFPVTMRITPTAIEYASITAYDAALTQYTPSAVALVAGQSGLDAGNVQLTVTGATAARAAVIIQSATTGYLAFSAEL
jgi:hypothetical protein